MLWDPQGRHNTADNIPRERKGEGEGESESERERECKVSGVLVRRPSSQYLHHLTNSVHREGRLYRRGTDTPTTADSKSLHTLEDDLGKIML